jgi:hypothetical protein
MGVIIALLGLNATKTPLIDLEELSKTVYDKRGVEIR